jgi:hypothetical protein
MWAVDVALIDLGFGHEAINVDRVRALDRNRVQLFATQTRLQQELARR